MAKNEAVNNLIDLHCLVNMYIFQVCNKGLPLKQPFSLVTPMTSKLNVMFKLVECPLKK